MPDKEQRLGEIGGYWLSQRPNSRQWCRTWFDATTRQTRRASLGTVDLEDAKLKLAGWLMTGGAMAREPASAVPLETVLVRYYEHHAKRLASGHQAQYSLKKWSDFFAGALVSELTPYRQRAFIASLRNQNYSDGYIRRVLQIGQAALNRALREGEIAIAPKVLVGEAPEGEARERILSMKEAATLLSAARTPQLAMFLLLAFGTAARPGAILELTTFQVNCDARLIRFNPPGRRQNWKRRPTVPICDTLLPYLRALPAGPVVAYYGKPIKSIRKTFERTRDRAERDRREKAPWISLSLSFSRDSTIAA